MVSTCRAQIIEVGYGPISNKGLGSLPNTSKIDISLLFKAYKSPAFIYVPGIRYTHVHSKNEEAVDETGTHVNGKFNMVFFIPVSFNFPIGNMAIITRFGFGFSGKHFPNKNGFVENFLLEAGLQYSLTSFLSLSLRYSHISNASLGKINPGVDNIKISAAFSF